ncbi:helix-turn-helix transcriptional regulator [Paenibacillus tepidiphilus]|uniref:helix-turn-helix transcriptional regulator n=1 Tax=Paenibacillus tepidiphilus TaxID=2608683 RepID=UPI00123BBDF2|nr:AraC family transcriptional regulator [Paenibacillus tepidiphilus]
MHDRAPMPYEPGSLMYVHKQEDEESHYYHAHRGIEILYIYKGQGDIMVEDQTYPIRDQTLVWFQPYQLHRVTVPSAPSRSYIRSNLTFDPGFMERYLAGFPVLAGFFRKMWKGTLTSQIFYSLHHLELDGLFEELHLAAESQATGKDESLGLLMLRLIRLIQQQNAGVPAMEGGPASRSETHAERINDWLDEHYKETFSLEDLAAYLHLSPYHISHLYKDSTGMTLTEYLIRRRVREACNLLANTGLSVQEIAAEVGGLSPSYFSQMFRKAKGMSPEQYKKSIR